MQNVYSKAVSCVNRQAANNILLSGAWPLFPPMVSCLQMARPTPQTETELIMKSRFITDRASRVGVVYLFLLLLLVRLEPSNFARGE